MDTIYLKIKIKESDKVVEVFRNQGLFFDCIAESLQIDRAQIEEVDSNNLSNSVKAVVKHWS